MGVAEVNFSEAKIKHFQELQKGDCKSNRSSKATRQAGNPTTRPRPAYAPKNHLQSS